MSIRVPNQDFSNALLTRAVVVMVVLAFAVLDASRFAAQAGQKEPRLSVTVDARVELMSIIFRLAGNPEYNQGKVASYLADVDEHFGPYRDHKVVELARNLRRTRGVSYDAVMSMAVHLTDAESLGEKVPLDPHPASLDARWRTDEAREFLRLARQFVSDSSFAEFVAEHQQLYQLAESRLQKVLDEHGHVEWFDQFFGSRPTASFAVAVGLLNGGGCYGPRFQNAEGREELYCILGAWSTDADGNPQFDENMLGTVVHEFCHSYANAIIEHHAEALRKAGEKMYPHVEDAMRRQAYGNWKTMMYESLVRACTVRYTMRYDSPAAAQRQIQNEQQRQFRWMGELSELLEEYEGKRDQYAALDDFAPRIVAFFDGYADKFVESETAANARRPQVVSITPANGATDVDPSITVLKVVFDRPMKDGSWSLVGGGENFPQVTGKPQYDRARKVWSVQVKLKPNWDYQYMLNSDRFTAFQGANGTPLAPVRVSFRTGSAK